MKRIIAIICITVMVILLFPIRGQMKDGGSVEYRAILYTVWDMHAIDTVQNEDGSLQHGYTVGTVIEIFGVEIFDNTKWVPQE